MIFKADISDQLPICFLLQSTMPKIENKVTQITKRITKQDAIEKFNQDLYKTSWDDIIKNKNPNEAYNMFLQKVKVLYDQYFPKQYIKIKEKDLRSPWITRGIKKFSKQKLYNKFLKNRNNQNEYEYKNYKKLFESIKKRAKWNYFSSLIIKYKNNIKKTWHVIKEAIRKTRCNNQTIFPKKVLIDEKIIANPKIIAENFNNFFIDTGPKLAQKIEAPTKTFESYLKKINKRQPEHPLTMNELKEAFFSLETNKCPGYDEISFNVIKNCFGSLSKPLLHVFRLSLEKGIFPDDLKIAKVMGAFKAGDENEFGNYRSISVFPCFSKILERIMYKRLYNHLLHQNILYHKQFGFQQGHSTEHTILQLTDQINDNFEKNYFTLGVFIDLSKVFDTVDHQILISKLKNYRIEGNNLNWFKNYLQNHKQYLILNKY